jgi:hypothetical protein
VLYRQYMGERGTWWGVGPSGVLDDCGDPYSGEPYYLASVLSSAPAGYAPDAPGYSAGEWYDDINGALVPITVTAGDGSATGGGDGR